ncbi:MAG: hypothetical protein U0792_18320 [Gemmataceae bacterium]
MELPAYRRRIGVCGHRSAGWAFTCEQARSLRGDDSGMGAAVARTDAGRGVHPDRIKAAEKARKREHLKELKAKEKLAEAEKAELEKLEEGDRARWTNSTASGSGGSLLGQAGLAWTIFPAARLGLEDRHEAALGFPACW